MFENLLEYNTATNFKKYELPKSTHISRATTAQSNNRKFRVTVMPRTPLYEIQKDQNTSVRKSIRTSIIDKNILAPYKNDIQLNKLTMGFLNYDKIKDFYNDEKSVVVEKSEFGISPKNKGKSQGDINIIEYLNPGNKNFGNFRIGNSEISIYL